MTPLRAGIGHDPRKHPRLAPPSEAPRNLFVPASRPLPRGDSIREGISHSPRKWRYRAGLKSLFAQAVHCDVRGRCAVALPKVAFNIFAENIGFKVHRIARSAMPNVGVFVRVGNHRDFHDRRLPPRDRQTDAVNRDGAFTHDVAGEILRNFHAVPPVVAFAFKMRHPPRAVDVPQNEMSAEFLARLQRLLEVHAFALLWRARRRAERRSADRFARKIRGKALLGALGHCKATAVHRDAVRHGKGMRERRRVNPHSPAVRPQFERFDRALVLDDAGEHRASVFPQAVACAGCETSRNASVKIASARSICSRVITSGGWNRATLPKIPPTPMSNPLRRQASRKVSASAAAGVFCASFTSSIPIISPSPRTSPMSGFVFCSSRSFPIAYSPVSAARAGRFSFSMKAMFASDAAQHTGFPPKVERWSPGL